MVCKIKAFPEDRSLVAPVINDLMKEARELFSLKVEKICTSQNKVAHELAHLALRLSQNCVSFAGFPLCIQELICNDAS